MNEKTTAKQEIIRCLALAERPLAVHEMDISLYNENNLSTRLSEMARDGAVVGEIRPGKKFKEWKLAAKLEIL